MTKAELIEKATGLGIELKGDETNATLEELIEKAEAEPKADPAPKLNRGSRRRIERASERFSSDMDAFIKEMRRQVFETDEDGNRIGDCDMVKAVRAMRDDVRTEINALLYPATD